MAFRRTIIVRSVVECLAIGRYAATRLRYATVKAIANADAAVLGEYRPPLLRDRHAYLPACTYRWPGGESEPNGIRASASPIPAYAYITILDSRIPAPRLAALPLAVNRADSTLGCELVLAFCIASAAQDLD